MPREAKHPRNSPQVNVKLTAEENAALDRTAAALSLPRSEVMRRSLVAYSAGYRYRCPSCRRELLAGEFDGVPGASNCLKCWAEAVL